MAATCGSSPGCRTAAHRGSPRVTTVDRERHPSRHWPFPAPSAYRRGCCPRRLDPRRPAAWPPRTSALPAWRLAAVLGRPALRPTVAHHAPPTPAASVTGRHDVPATSATPTTASPTPPRTPRRPACRRRRGHDARRAAGPAAHGRLRHQRARSAASTTSCAARTSAASSYLGGWDGADKVTRTSEHLAAAGVGHEHRGRRAAHRRRPGGRRGAAAARRPASPGRRRPRSRRRCRPPR